MRLAPALLASALALPACVPEATPDPCLRCEAGCEQDRCVPRALATLEGAVLALDVGPRFVHTCIQTGEGPRLVDVPRDGGEPALRATLDADCVGVRARPELGYVYVGDRHAVRRGALDGGPLALVAPLGELGSFDVSPALGRAIDPLLAQLYSFPVEGGTPVPMTVTAPDVLGPVRLSPGGRMAVVEPLRESVRVALTPSATDLRTAFNAAPDPSREPALFDVAFVDEQLVVAHADTVWLVRLDALAAPAPLLEGLTGPVRLATREHLVVAAEGGGRVLATDLLAREPTVLADGLSDPIAAIDADHVVLGESNGRLSRVPRPDR